MESVTSNWEIAYYISSFVIALVAVAGFISAQRSSEKVSEALTVIQRGLSSLSEPLIKFSGYKWTVGGNGENNTQVSASNPPHGIVFGYVNASNVPIQIIESSFEVLYGSKLIDDPGAPIGTESKETFILAPNESVHNGINNPEVFVRYLSKPKDIVVPPHINIKLWVKFKTMDNECYKYSIHREIHFDIARPSLQTSKTLQESLERET